MKFWVWKGCGGVVGQYRRRGRPAPPSGPLVHARVGGHGLIRPRLERTRRDRSSGLPWVVPVAGGVATRVSAGECRAVAVVL